MALACAGIRPRKLRATGQRRIIREETTEVLLMTIRFRYSCKWTYLSITTLALLYNLVWAYCATAGPGTFDSLSFFEKNTTFFVEFPAFRKQWFGVENRIAGIKDEYQPVDWSAIRNSAKEVVVKHEKVTVKFARDCRAAIGRLPSAQSAQAQGAIATMLEYLDAVGLVVLKLYQISEKLYGKTMDPYSYTMEEYNADFRKYKELNEKFEKKGKEVNLLLYGKVSPGR
jgi:hypothetical protein